MSYKSVWLIAILWKKATAVFEREFLEKRSMNMNTCSVFHYNFLLLLGTKQNNKGNLKISNLNFANFIFKSQKTTETGQALVWKVVEDVTTFWNSKA